MEVINTYVNSLFAGLPADERLERARNDLLATMEEHYNDLKADGKSENEAVGTVISQFGNIDELLEELDIRVAQPEEPAAEPDYAIHLTKEQALEYLAFRRKFGWRVGVGVMMCILAPAALIATESVLTNIAGLGSRMADGFALGALFVLIAAAVCLFVFSGVQNEKYERYEKEKIALTEDTVSLVEEKLEANKKSFAGFVCAGLALVFAGLITVGCVDAFFGGIDFAGDMSVTAMLAMIAVGVMFFCRAGSVRESYDVLLNTKKREYEMKYAAAKDGSRPKGKLFLSIFTAVLWPLTVILFFVWSFAFNGWALSWIVFPIAGLLNGIASSIVHALNE